METQTIAGELLALVKALAIATRNDFMSHDHASAVWKRNLGFTAYDVPKIINTNKNEEAKKDGITKKD